MTTVLYGVILVYSGAMRPRINWRGEHGQTVVRMEALIPYAMKMFGTVTSAGTLHAPYAKWGVAATMQKMSAMGYTNVYYLAGSAALAAAMYARSNRLK